MTDTQAVINNNLQIAGYNPNMALSMSQVFMVVTCLYISTD
jgi:hypothetical protein